MLKLAIIGANGKMGKLTEEAVKLMKNVTIVARILSTDNLAEVLIKTQPDIAIDVTSHLVVKENTWTIIKNKVYPIIGTSGLLSSETVEIEEYCLKHKQGGIYVPNFSVGIALANRLVKDLKQYFTDFSIVEFHHAAKKDKPSGTARYTANILDLPEEQIASVRANGFLSKQQVYINSEHERLIIDHESFSRQSFIQGIQLSISKVMTLDHFVVGLEQIL